MNDNCAIPVTAERTECRPFLKWAGGKSQLLPELRKRVPPEFNRYLEPFIGGGALFFSLQPERAYLSDSNADLMNCFSVVQTEVDKLIAELSDYKYERDFYYHVRELDRKPEFASTPSVKRAARLIYLNRTCFNGLYRVNSKGHFNVPFGRYTNPTILNAANLSTCSAALQRTVLATAPFHHITEVAEKDDFVYFDPPYAPTSETADFTSYVRDGFDESAQELLLVTCLQLHRQGVKWMVSNSNTPLIQELYRGFRIEPVFATRAINSRADRRGAVIELVIRNYE